MRVEVLREVLEPREPRLLLEIALALIQPDKFELVLQKATELGAASFLPITTERTEVRAERVAGKEDRWRKILLEAAKQSGRLVVPKLAAPEAFEVALARPGVNVLLDPAGAAAPPPGDSLRLFIGPEGGWSNPELARAAAMGAASWSLGPLRLRAETAAIAGVATVLLRTVGRARARRSVSRPAATRRRTGAAGPFTPLSRTRARLLFSASGLNNNRRSRGRTAALATHRRSPP